MCIMDDHSADIQLRHKADFQTFSLTMLISRGPARSIYVHRGDLNCLNSKPLYCQAQLPVCQGPA